MDTSLILHPRQPFSFARSLEFLCGFSPTAGEQQLDGRSITKAVQVDGRTVAFAVEEAAEGGGLLSLRLCAEREVDVDVAAAVDRVRFFLSLDDDLEPFYALARRDPPLRPILERLFGFHQVKLMTPFENACWAVLGQRCPQPVARQMKDRLVAEHGGRIELEGRVYRSFPEPKDLLGVDLERPLNNTVKARRIRAVTEAFAAVREAELRVAPIDELFAWLRGIEGIGPWSAAFVALRGLGRTERLAGAEAQLLESAGSVYGIADRSEFRRIAERYGLWQGYWALYVRTGSAYGLGGHSSRSATIGSRREARRAG
jgi:DNA-3-methyladenine glycosylase II